MNVFNSAQQTAQQISAYWTPQRREAAVPEPLLHRSREQAPAAPQSGYAAPVPCPTDAPWCRVGKLFYRRGNSDCTASASVIDRTGLLTAAHCLYDPATGIVSESILFVPAYTNRTEPFGHWVSAATVYPHKWTQAQNNWAYDVGCIVLRAGGKGAPHPIGDTTGVLDYVWGQATAGVTWNGVAYPSNYDGGKVMYEELGVNRPSPFAGTVGKAGTFSPGASGGPWLIGDNQSTVNGVQSFVDAQYPGDVFSAYFADWVHTMISATFSH